MSKPSDMLAPGQRWLVFVLPGAPGESWEFTLGTQQTPNMWSIKNATLEDITFAPTYWWNNNDISLLYHMVLLCSNADTKGHSGKG